MLLFSFNYPHIVVARTPLSFGFTIVRLGLPQLHILQKPLWLGFPIIKPIHAWNTHVLVEFDRLMGLFRENLLFLGFPICTPIQDAWTLFYPHSRYHNGVSHVIHPHRSAFLTFYQLFGVSLTPHHSTRASKLCFPIRLSPWKPYLCPGFPHTMFDEMPFKRGPYFC